MNIETENRLEKAIEKLDLQFKTGNAIDVERVYIYADDYANLKAFALAELRRRQSNRHWADVADRQL